MALLVSSGAERSSTSWRDPAPVTQRSTASISELGFAARPLAHLDRLIKDQVHFLTRVPQTIAHHTMIQVQQEQKMIQKGYCLAQVKELIKKFHFLLPAEKAQEILEFGSQQCPNKSAVIH